MIGWRMIRNKKRLTKGQQENKNSPSCFDSKFKPLILESIKLYYVLFFICVLHKRIFRQCAIQLVSCAHCLIPPRNDFNSWCLFQILISPWVIMNTWTLQTFHSTQQGRNLNIIWNFDIYIYMEKGRCIFSTISNWFDNNIKWFVLQKNIMFSVWCNSLE